MASVAQPGGTAPSACAPQPGDLDEATFQMCMLDPSVANLELALQKVSLPNYGFGRFAPATKGVSRRKKILRTTLGLVHQYYKAPVVSQATNQFPLLAKVCFAVFGRAVDGKVTSVALSADSEAPLHTDDSNVDLLMSLA